MTVQELIEVLQNCPPDALVLFSEYDLGKHIDFVEHKVVKSPLVLPRYHANHDRVFLQEFEPDWEGMEDYQIEVISQTKTFARTKYHEKTKAPI